MHQASLSITNSQSLLKLMPIKSVMPSSHLILCRPLDTAKDVCLNRQFRAGRPSILCCVDTELEEFRTHTGWKLTTKEP